MLVCVTTNEQWGIQFDVVEFEKDVGQRTVQIRLPKQERPSKDILLDAPRL